MSVSGNKAADHRIWEMSVRPKRDAAPIEQMRKESVRVVVSEALIKLHGKETGDHADENLTAEETEQHAADDRRHLVQAP